MSSAKVGARMVIEIGHIGVPQGEDRSSVVAINTGYNGDAAMESNGMGDSQKCQTEDNGTVTILRNEYSQRRPRYMTTA